MASAAPIRQAPVSHHSHGAPRHRESSAENYPSGFHTAYPTSKPGPPSTGQYWSNTRAPVPHSRAKGPALKLQTSYKQQRILPDVDDEDSMYPPHRSHAKEARRPARLQPSRHGQRPSQGSPISPTGHKRPSLRSPPSDLAVLPEGSEEHASAALRRANKEKEAVVRYKVEGFEHKGQKEHRRLSETQNRPVSAKNDDAWGTSMYDVEVDGRR